MISNQIISIQPRCTVQLFFTTIPCLHMNTSTEEYRIFPLSVIQILFLRSCILRNVGMIEIRVCNFVFQNASQLQETASSSMWWWRRDYLGKLSKIKTTKHMEFSICWFTPPHPTPHPPTYGKKTLFFYGLKMLYRHF